MSWTPGAVADGRSPSRGAGRAPRGAIFHTQPDLPSISPSPKQYYTIFGQWLVYLTPTQQLAQTLGSNANFAFNLVSGFIQPYPSIPVSASMRGQGVQGLRCAPAPTRFSRRRRTRDARASRRPNPLPHPLAPHPTHS